MRSTPLAISSCTLYRNVTGVSGAQSTLVLLLIVLMLVAAARYTVGDSVISAAEMFAGFRVWGAENVILGSSGSAPEVSITVPADGGVYYHDEAIGIVGQVAPDAGKKAALVYYRVNKGDWVKAAIQEDQWRGAVWEYPEGAHLVEAVAYDDRGGESAPASAHFTSLFRYYPDAKLLGDDVPDTMAAGDVYDCHVTFENTGNLPWNRSGEYALAPYSGTAFGAGPCAIAGPDVLPGSRVTFTIRLIAPPLPGHYDVSCRMRGGGYGWFGEALRKPVQVVDPAYDAKVASIDMPASMVQGETFIATITMKNTGTAAWYAQGQNVVSLNIVGGSGGDAYRMAGVSSVPLAPLTTVRPGEAYAFKFNILALSPGLYHPEFRMAREGTGTFGETAAATVRVMPGATPTPEPTARPQYEAFVAYGKFFLGSTNGEQLIGGPWGWCYDGPLCHHNQRSSYFSEPWWPYPDWDIGGPEGLYRIYSDYFTGEKTFSMDGGGDKGTVVLFHERR